jgi:hypothetical protein
MERAHPRSTAYLSLHPGRGLSRSLHSQRDRPGGWRSTAGDGDANGDGGVGSGPRPGDRAPDCRGLVRPAVNHPLRLFELLADPDHTLLLYTDDTAQLSMFGEIKKLTATLTGGRARTYVITATPDSQVTGLPGDRGRRRRVPDRLRRDRRKRLPGAARRLPGVPGRAPQRDGPAQPPRAGVRHPNPRRRGDTLTAPRPRTLRRSGPHVRVVASIERRATIDGSLRLYRWACALD